MKPIRINGPMREELLGLGFDISENKPLDLLFYKNCTKSCSRLVCAHTTSRQLPPGSLVRLSEHVLIASPELVFSQIAEDRSFEQLIMAGCELCGTYRLFGDGGPPLSLPEERPRLTRAADIAGTLQRFGLGPRTTAVRAARYVFDNARSPMEAKVALLLSLPPRLGGFGLPRPALNPDFYLGPEAYSLYPRKPCHPDLFWADARLDVEYDGADTHTAEAHAKDVARAAAFACEGVTVLTIAKAQAYDRRAFETVAGVIASRLHRHLPACTPAFDLAHMRLRRELGF